MIEINQVAQEVEAGDTAIVMSVRSKELSLTVRLITRKLSFVVLSCPVKFRIPLLR